MAFQDDLAATALREWERFGKDTGEANHTATYTNGEGKKITVNKEEAPDFAKIVGDYWLAISSADYSRLVKHYALKLGKLDGTVTKLPWSAAFISYCFQTSGAGDKFPYSPGHATWIRLAIKNKQSGKIAANLVGYRLSEEPVRVGDLLAKARGDKKTDITYDNVLQQDWFESHSDIVVAVKSSEATIVGGNVGQSVSMRPVKLDAEGCVADTSWLTMIRNNISPATVPPAKPMVLAKVG